MYNLKVYQICHDLIAYFATLTSPKKSQLGLIFRTGGSIMYFELRLTSLLFVLIENSSNKLFHGFILINNVNITVCTDGH